ncbi:SDR family oxidoreductase [Streptomyces sp. NPDC001652]|uniref:SDR family oxidoreductase n=1 Tax=Streptomyces sp. NPDC001652 TaxID=3154393 RepID=UPI00332E8575
MRTAAQRRREPARSMCPSERRARTDSAGPSLCRHRTARARYGATTVTAHPRLARSGQGWPAGQDPMRSRTSSLAARTIAPDRCILARTTQRCRWIFGSGPKRPPHHHHCGFCWQEHGGQAIAVQADISQPADIDRLFTEAKERFGAIDIVVANAGLELLGTPIAELTDEQIDRMVNVNARGTLLTLQRAAQHVSDHGRIINIASTAIEGPYPGTGLYTATKAPGRHFAEVLAREVAERAITVNTIEPGPIDEAGVFIDSIPSDVADTAEYLAGELAAWVSGTTIIVTGGLPQ